MNYLNTVTGIEVWALWAVLAIGLLIIEILTVIGFFVSFSAAAFGIAAWAYFNPSTAELWQWLVFSVLGLVLYFPIRVAIQKFANNRADINQY